MKVSAYNRDAWNHQVEGGNEWTRPVSAEVIADARQGKWAIRLTPNRDVPTDWLGDVAGKVILGLASGGGQQMPVLAAAGAKVVSFDNSDRQLEQDHLVAAREGLTIETVRGDMADLSALTDNTFDLIFHPVSNVFAEDILSVWREAHRVLKPGGRLMAGFMNPSYFLFDHEEAERSGKLIVTHRLPYSDLTHQPPEVLEQLERDHIPLEFSHSLETQITGQLRSGLQLIDLFEDDWSEEATPLHRYGPMFIATCSQKQ